MTLVLRLRQPSGEVESREFLDVDRDAVIKDHEEREWETLLTDWLRAQLAIHGLFPEGGDTSDLKVAADTWINRTGGVVEIRVTRRRPPDPEKEAAQRSNIEDAIRKALEQPVGHCHWVVHDNEINALERIEAAVKAAGYTYYKWNLLPVRWAPALPVDPERRRKFPELERRGEVAHFARGIDDATLVQPSNRVCLVFQDIPTSDSILEETLIGSLMTELVSLVNTNPNLRLLIIRPSPAIPARWRGLFHLLRLDTTQTGTPVLDALGEDFTAKARAGKIAPAIERDKELTALLDIMNRTPGLPNSPLLVGEAGVGKTAIVEELARRIVLQDPQILPRFQGRRVMSLNVTALTAGTNLRGDLESRLQALIHELESHADELIVFVDEIHMLMKAGGDDAPAAQALKASLGRGTLSLIGATTTAEAVQVESDPAFARRFSQVLVDEPGVDATIKIVKSRLGRMKAHHHLEEISDEMVKKAVDDADWHILTQQRPYSAIALLGQAAAIAERQGDKKLTAAHIDEALNVTVHMKVSLPDKEEQHQLKKLEALLNKNIKAQEGAIGRVMRAIRAHRMSRARKPKPFSMLLVGPSGVGKTELAVQIGKALFEKAEPIIYHMEVYQSQHQVTDLLGAPASYVGYDQGSRLVNDIRKNPRTVILIDEVEKAHPAVITALMGILDRGEYWDPRGILGDFRHAYFLITSNIVRDEKELDLEDDAFNEIILKNFAKRRIKPEQVARFGPKVKFQYLSESTLAEIAATQLRDFKAELYEAYRLTLSIDDSVIRWLAAMAWANKATGARRIADLILDLRGQVVDAFIDDDSITHLHLTYTRGANGCQVFRAAPERG